MVELSNVDKILFDAIPSCQVDQATNLMLEISNAIHEIKRERDAIKESFLAELKDMAITALDSGDNIAADSLNEAIYHLRDSLLDGEDALAEIKARAVDGFIAHISLTGIDDEAFRVLCQEAYTHKCTIRAKEG